MELLKSTDIFVLSTGDVVTKRNLYDLIQYSKVLNSSFWAGEEMKINNTPQQGINWIGDPETCLGVIIKTKPGSYAEDGWSDSSKQAYHYSFKAKEGEVSYSEKANKVLINQPRYLYPIFLFSEDKSSWKLEGTFSVIEIESKHVILSRGLLALDVSVDKHDERQYQEGERKYVTHLMAERNLDAVNDIKASIPWKCDICALVFSDSYEVPYIEAHHKTPISTYSAQHIVTKDDFALLCPNCHKAVHIYMQKQGLEYQEIKDKLNS